MIQSQSAGLPPESISAEPALENAHLSTVLASVPGIGQQSLRATLESLSLVHVVGTAAGCLSAMQMVRQRQADLVVIDANLPFEDVQVFLQQLRQDGLATRALVLATTHGQVREALATGADGALRRDASIRQLTAKVDRLYRARLVDREEASSAAFSDG